MSAMDTHAWLQVLLEDIATTPTPNSDHRHALLVDALAPLEAADADRQAVEIEKHSYWVRRGPDSTGGGRACDPGARNERTG